MKVLLFGGTTEGRTFGEWLFSRGIDTTVCVATEYGGTLLPQGIDVRVGRLDCPEMATLMVEGYTHIIDATHPYAAVVTGNIQESAQQNSLPYYRLLRDGAPEGDWLHGENVAQAAELCKTLEGNILLTTGSKELEPFGIDGLRQRTFPRVLPTVEGVSRCLGLQFSVGQIIAMQGPFSQRLNEGLIEQLDISVMVTKASGGTGGFWEKVAAAKACGVTLVVIDRPRAEIGYTLEELKQLEIFR